MNRWGLCGALVAAMPVLAQQLLDRTPSPDLVWRMSYFHDEDRSVLSLVGLEAGGGGCAVALGRLHTDSSVLPVALRTGDAGKSWEIVRLDRSSP